MDQQKWTELEFEYAVNNNKIILPIQYSPIPKEDKDLSFPTVGIEFVLSGTQWFNFTFKNKFEEKCEEMLNQAEKLFKKKRKTQKSKKNK